MKRLPEITDKVKKNLIWKSIFRRDYRNTIRDRAQAVFGNVFLHLHPVQVRESAVKLRFTWGMGGITFFAFIILVITGVVLMFYYHPSVDQAYSVVMINPDGSRRSEAEYERQLKRLRGYQ